MTNEAEKLLHYVTRRYCPHDIVQRDFVNAFTSNCCDYLHETYKDPCAVCWDKFITEVFRDINEEDYGN